jgi:hypothetical protein
MRDNFPHSISHKAWPCFPLGEDTAVASFFEKADADLVIEIVKV